MINFLPLGGADEIGANCFYLNVFGTGNLLDCGIHPRKTGLDSLPGFGLIEDLPLDFVLISHAHQDHIGSLPFLVQKFPHVIIYSTTQTKEIAEATLHNAANILAQNPSLENDFKIYTHEEIDLLVRSIRGVNYNEVISIKGMRHTSSSGINVSFHDAGHILGSAGILLEHNNQKIFFSGDINFSDQSIMIGCDLKGIRNIDVLILESTYGSTDSKKLGTWSAETERLIKSANKVIHDGGSILIPVFALGKTQELLSLLHSQMIKRKLTETNIFTGGVGREISNIYDRNRYLTRRSSSDLLLKEIPQQNIFEIEDLTYFQKNPSIVLASSGMILEGTTSFKLLDFWMHQKNFAVFGVGYMDESTPGFRLMNSQKGDKIKLTVFSEPKKVNCSVERFYFPSHSIREDLIKVAKSVNPRKVILVHGDINSKDWLGHKILELYPHIKVASAETGKSFLL
ncbi:MAG: MBL fold metallo-hydrolase [Melioribacter sp.]|nr:MBL fold metallo-hydrolase [Melioribacter sp.]